MSTRTSESPAIGGANLRLHDVACELGASAQQLLRSIEAAGHEVEALLRERVERKPYGTLGAALGLGYVLGGGLPTRLTSALLVVVSRIALAAAAREIVEASSASSASVDKPSPTRRSNGRDA
jgi:hypothetical protein